MRSVSEAEHHRSEVSASCTGACCPVMQIGDNVRVRSSARHARIIEDRGHSRYRVLFYSDPAVDALDSATVQDEDNAGGIYEGDDLEVIP